MDKKNKPKSKKRRTRRSLNDLRKKSRREVKNNNENTLGFKNMPKCDNELITCKRLTLTLFKKAVTSKTVTRLPLSRIDDVNPVRVHANCNNNLTSQTLNGVSVIGKNALESPKFDTMSKKQACGNIVNENVPSSVTSCSIFHSELGHAKVSSEEDNYNHEYLNNYTSGSNSEAESSHCYYEEIMKEIPVYLKQNFPIFNSNYINKNLIYLKQTYLENFYQKKENDSWKYIEPSINTSPSDRESIIQRPIDYIHKGMLWEQNEGKKLSKLPSNSSSPSFSEFESNPSNISFLNSPDYHYFPHKLNQ